jgi:hypothetical protein
VAVDSVSGSAFVDMKVLMLRFFVFKNAGRSGFHTGLLGKLTYMLATLNRSPARAGYVKLANIE